MGRTPRKGSASSQRPRGRRLVLPPDRIARELARISRHPYDEADARELLRTILAQCGAEVTVAANAQEALEALKQARFDVLVSDIVMPDEDGYDSSGTSGRSTPSMADRFRLSPSPRMPESKIERLRSRPAISSTLPSRSNRPSWRGP
jgi:Response regulator receiver domain